MPSQIPSNRFLPFRRADAVVDCSLFWLPVSGFPLRTAESDWIRRWILELKKVAQAKLGLRMEYFLQQRVLYPDLMDPFLRSSIEHNPVGGICIRWNRPAPKPLTPADVEEMIASGKTMQADRHMNDQLYWFAKKNHEKQMGQFFGYGGSQAIWSAPDPNTPKFPPLFSKKVIEDPRFKPLDIQGTLDLTASLADSLLPKSREVFGGEAAKELQLQGMPFFLPAFTTQDILTARAEQRAQWLEFMPLYVAESPSDQGMVALASHESEPLLLEALEIMNQMELKYPTR